MIKISRGSVLCAMAGAAAAFGGCQSILPGDGPSRLAMRQAPVVASSGQRLGADGYPLLGAFPNSAGPQIDNATVETERSGLQSSAAAQTAGASTTAAAYQQKLAEMQAIKAQQRQDAAAALSGTPAPRSPISTGGAAGNPTAVLREIEGRR